MVIFQQLKREQLREIANLQLEKVRQRLADRHITLDITTAALDFLSDEGFDPVYGARPLKRVIQRRLLDRLALEMVGGQIKDHATVVVDIQEGNLVMTVKNRPAEAETSTEIETVGASTE